MPDPTAPRPVSVESPGNDGFRYEPAPEPAPVWGDEPVCWAEDKPGSGVRCGLSVDHDARHYFNTWEG